MLRTRIVFWVIFYSLRYGVNPWRFFQLNAPWFNQDKNIFSKLDIDTYIPERWRLSQESITDTYTPSSFPIFLKPEWGQNAHGIFRIESMTDWDNIKGSLDKNLSYIAQQAAAETTEFEIFYLRDSNNLQNFADLSIVLVDNDSDISYPINSIRNPDTKYKDVTNTFSQIELQQLWSIVGSVGEFKIARVCCCCASREKLLGGDFEIVEINLFVPMPLLLLDNDIHQQQKTNFVRMMGRHLALLIKTIPANQPYRGIFFSKWAIHRKTIKWNALKK